MPTPNRKQSGFTLMELLVTMAVLSLLLFMINELFQNTSGAVTRSVQTSKVIATHRIIGEAINDDFSNMLGPGAGEDGYIVIVQERIQNVTMVDPFTFAEVTIPEIRSDQVLFIRDAEGLRSLTPQSDQSFHSNLVGDSGGKAKVWLGHGRRTDANGRETGSGLGASDAGLDSRASDWILCRQALLFNPTDTTVDNRGVQLGPINRNGGADLGQYTYATNAYHTSPVNNPGTGAPSPARTYKGLTDVTALDYGSPTTPSTFARALTVGTTPAQIATQNDRYLLSAYINNRLQINTAPDAALTEFRSWAIAQGHAILSPGTSDFIVDFAADLNGNGRVDQINGGEAGVNGDNNVNRHIHWYDALWVNRNGTPGTPTYQWANPDGVAFPDFIQPLVVDLPNRKVFIFRIGDDTPHPGPVGTARTHSKWPYMIRLRYRLHDTRGKLVGNSFSNTLDGVDNNGDTVADENGEEKTAGIWFEHIIKVNRP